MNNKNAKEIMENLKKVESAIWSTTRVAIIECNNGLTISPSTSITPTRSAIYDALRGIYNSRWFII